MPLALVAFLVMVATIVGGYMAVTYLPDLIANRKLERRLRDISIQPVDATDGPTEDGVVKRERKGPMPSVDRLFVGSPLSRLIEQSGLETTPSGIVMISLLGAGLLALVSMFIARQPFVPFIGGALGLSAPTLWLMRSRSARLKRFEEQFPEALDLLSRAIRAGHAFQTAMSMVADELPAPVGREFRKTFDQQNFGLPLRDALNELADRVSILDVRFFVTAVLIQRESGGNLAEILDNLSRVVRERFKIRRQVRVHTAHGRFTGYVLLALPASLGVALNFINPDLMRLLFEERMGHMLLAAAIGLQFIGFLWIRQVIKIEV